MNKNQFWLLVSCFIMFGLSAPMYCFFGLRNQLEADVYLDKALESSLPRVNRWGYRIDRYPHTSRIGLTYDIESWFRIINNKIDSIDEVEKLFIEIYREYFYQMNSIRSLRPFLDTFPMTPFSCVLSIGFQDSNGEPVRPPYISGVILRKGVLEFSKYVGYQSNTLEYYETIHERPAQKIPGLKELYNPSMPRKAVEIKPKIPEYVEPRNCPITPVDTAQLDFTKKLCSDNELSITTFGTVGKSHFDRRAFEWALHGFQKLTLDAGKLLAAKCCKALLDFANTNRAYLEYLKVRTTWINEKYPSPTPIPEQFAFRISFWDENIDRPVAPYVAEIRLLDGKLSYFTADDNQQLVLAFEETFSQSIARNKGSMD